MVKAGEFRGGIWDRYLVQFRRVYSPEGISPAVCRSHTNDNSHSIKIVVENGEQIDKAGDLETGSV